MCSYLVRLEGYEQGRLWRDCLDVPLLFVNAISTKILCFASVICFSF